jgi:hypothetical protein
VGRRRRSCRAGRVHRGTGGSSPGCSGR